MHQFTPTSGSFKQVRKPMIAMPVIIMVVVIAVTLYSSSGDKSDANVTPFITGFLCLIMIYSIFRSVSRQKLMFESYRLIIDDNTITRERLNTPTITIACADISEIIKNKNGSFVIKAKSSRDNIFIPAQISDGIQLETLLDQISKVTVMGSDPVVKQYFNIVTVFLALAGMACVYIANNKIIVGAASLVVAVLMLWSLYQIRTNKNLDVKTKRFSFYVLIVLVSIIVIVYQKLSA